MSLHDIMTQRMMLANADPFKESFNKSMDEAMSSMQALALHSAKLAQAQIAEEQKAEQQRIQNARATEQLLKMPIPENTDAETIMSIGDGGIDVKRVLKPKTGDSFKERREERIATQAELSNATKLRSEFINRPEVKDFVTVSTNVGAMEKLLDTALQGNDKKNFVAIDQGIITMYNKLTDPQSVVRESEYARTPENLPMVNRISGAIGKVQAGGAGLTNDDRKALVEGAKIILKERANPYNSALTEYEELANQYGLNPSMVTRNMKPYMGGTKNVSVSGDATPTFSSEQEAESAGLPKGTIVIINGRKARID